MASERRSGSSLNQNLDPEPEPEPRTSAATAQEASGLRGAAGNNPGGGCVTPRGDGGRPPGQLSSRGLVPPRILRVETLPTQEAATMDRHTGLNGKYHWPTGFFIPPPKQRWDLSFAQGSARLKDLLTFGKAALCFFCKTAREEAFIKA